MKVFEVIKADIENLDQNSLTNLMHKLLHAELSKLKMKQSQLIISLDINDPDGGLDGYINCDIPENHSWLPSGKSGWQFKADRNFGKPKIRNHVLNDRKNDIKSRVKKLLQQNETYVLIIGKKDYNQVKLEEIEMEIKKAFENYGISNAKVKVYSSGQIADWVNIFPSVIAYLKPDRINFKDMKEWKESSLVIREPKHFVTDSKRDNIIQSLRENIVSNQNKERATIIRLVGLTGIGKTRLVYESLNTKELKDLVIYTESPDKLPRSRFNEIAENGDTTAIFVIDECSHDKYVELNKEAEGIGGRVTLFTLDYDIDRPCDSKDIHFTLEKLDESAIDELIKFTFPGLPEMARRKIVNFSEGYPKIAVVLSENFSSHPELLSPDTLSKLAIDDLFNRMIAGRHSDESKIDMIKKILTSIALFKKIGWDDDISFQGKKICELLGIDWNEARKIVEEQEKRGLVIRRGRYRYVSPLPLAIYLSSNWWRIIERNYWREFYDNLPDVESKKAFLNRLSDLSYFETAKKIIINIFSEFNYDLLNNEGGSEIFLDLAKTDHLTALDTLEHILGTLPKEKLVEFRKGRRNIVWSLEKIVWWPDTFHRAARILLKLADAENETFSNNATGVFAQLFQTFRGGTAVPAWERHSILKETLDSKNGSLQKLALKGLSSAFESTSSFRVIGGEEQGAILPPPEWNPLSQEDLKKSILSALDIFYKAITIPDSEIQIESVKILLSHIRIILSYGFKDEIMEALQRINERFPKLEKEIIKAVEEVLYFDGNQLPMDVVKELRDFRNELIGSNFRGLMKRYVRNRLLEDELEENRMNIEKIHKELAEESLIYPEKLNEEMVWLITPEAENGYMFGKKLGEVDIDYYWLNVILQALKDAENPSVFFYSGYLSSIKLRNMDLWERVLNECYNNKILKKYLLEIIWRSDSSDKGVEFVIIMLKNHEIDPREIKLFTYGAWFQRISTGSFLEFLNEFYKIENGKYSSVVLGIIYQYIEICPAILDEAHNILLDYLTNHAIIENADTMTMYYWDELTKKLMDKFSYTLPHFIDFVLTALSKKNNVYFEPHFNHMLEYFLKEDIENTWKKLKIVLLVDNLLTWNLIRLLKGDYANFRKEKNSLLGLIPEKYIWEWVNEYPNEAPIMLARIIPIHEFEPLLHPLARYLLIRFPLNRNLASELSSNWHSEGIKGPLSKYFEVKMNIAEEWEKDSEIPVANWARKELKWIKERLRITKIEEEEMDI